MLAVAQGEVTLAAAVCSSQREVDTEAACAGAPRRQMPYRCCVQRKRWRSTTAASALQAEWWSTRASWLCSI